MKTNLKSKWWLNLALFAVFLTAYFLNLTGLALHQWIGLAAGLFALYHLVSRWSWVKAVSARLLGKTSRQAVLYYTVDALLLVGLATILFTGVVISSWLNWSLANYALWRVVHITASLSTLLALAVKLGMHWRWIVTTARKVFTAPAPVRRAPAQVTALSRREFFKVVGVVGASSLFALGSSFKGLQDAAVQASIFSVAELNDTAVPATNTPTAAPAYTTATAPVGTSAPSGFAATATEARPVTLVSTATPASTATPVSTSTSSGCVALCNRGCSFPGKCRRYIDSNSNNRCDRGECL